MSLGRFYPETIAELLTVTSFHSAVVVRNDSPGGDNRVKVLCPIIFGKEGVSNWITCCGSSIGPENSSRKQTGMHNPARLKEQGLVFFPGGDIKQPTYMSAGIHRNTPGDPGNDNDPSGSYGTSA
jgi:hypothetical protein